MDTTDTTDTSALPKLPTDLGAARLGLDPTAGSSVGAMGPSLGGRASRGLARFLIIFSIGIGATLAWQSYGDAARAMLANSSPQLGNSAEALGNSARGDRCTGAQTDPGNGASVTFSVSISFSTTALKPTAHDLPKTRTPPECGAGSREPSCAAG